MRLVYSNDRLTKTIFPLLLIRWLICPKEAIDACCPQYRGHHRAELPHTRVPIISDATCPVFGYSVAFGRETKALMVVCVLITVLYDIMITSIINVI